jgi:hypothetical protein
MTANFVDIAAVLQNLELMFHVQNCTDLDSNSPKNWDSHQDPDPYSESGPNRPGQMIAQNVRKKD